MKLVIVDDFDIEMVENEENIFFRMVDFVIAKIIYRLFDEKSCYLKKKVSKYVLDTLGFENLKEDVKPKLDENTMILVVRHIFEDDKMPSKDLIFEHRDRGIIQFWLATKHGW